MSRDWSQLPQDLLETISTKLTIYIDYIRFRGVCITWRSNIPPKPHHLPIQIPWLMIPHIQTRGNFRCFYSLTDHKLHLLNLPEARYKRCCGSSQGWLVLVEQQTPNILVINPLTKIQFHLPPITLFPNVLELDNYKVGKEYLLQTRIGGDRYTRNLKEMCDVFIKKVILSSRPDLDDYIAVAILNETGELAFCRKGESSWSMIDDASYYCEDAIFYKGLLYAVENRGKLAICDVSGEALKVTKIDLMPIYGCDILYLVASVDELLLVVRYLDLVERVDNVEIVYQTVRFEVFALHPKDLSWVPVSGLGDRMLFLGGNSSVCLMASDFRGCKGNCIYFTDDYTEDDVCGDHDVGVFNLGDGSIEPLPCYTGNQQLFWPPHIWVTANPC